MLLRKPLARDVGIKGGAHALKIDICLSLPFHRYFPWDPRLIQKVVTFVANNLLIASFLTRLFYSHLLFFLNSGP